MKRALNDSQENCGKSRYETPQYLLYIYFYWLCLLQFQEQSRFYTEQHVAKPWLEPGSSSDPDSIQEPDLKNPCVQGLLLALFAYDWFSVSIQERTRTNQKRDIRPRDRDFKKSTVSREI